MGSIRTLKHDNVILSIIPLENGLKIEKDNMINGLWSRMGDDG